MIAVGGALGAITRYALGGWVQEWTASPFPWGTLVVNLTGCLFLGFVLRALELTLAPAEWRALLIIGFASAYTTFSTFSYETLALLRDGQLARAGLYVLVSNLVGLAAVLIGFLLAGALLSGPPPR
jgi:CrcB protein